MADIIERYDRLKQYLGIDMLDLEHSFMVTPRVLEDVGELAALADQIKNIAKHQLDIAMSTAANRIREPWVASNTAQTRIDSELRIMVPLAPEVIEARDKFNRTIYEAECCASLFTSLKEQSRLLGKAADLLTTGFIKPSALSDRRREEYRRSADQQNESDRVRRPSYRE
jgi:hypothetical protein